MSIQLFLITTVAILIRWCISLNNYSGQGRPPMFGDYEAQRHWMEITFHLPASDWYKNTSDNDLQYWGLDYPPLTAYHSYICGYISNSLDTRWVALNESRGFESEHHKLFMRYSVIVADLLVFIPAVLFYFHSQWRYNSQQRLSGIITMLFYPGLILIDHGHFQFNGVSLGAALLAATFIVKYNDLLAAIFFCLALNYKQMELYHALPFFCYLLGSCFKGSFSKCYLKFSMLAVLVLITFGVCWLPFLKDMPTALSVLQRLFPFSRGLYEDKVANVWCSLSFLIKFKELLHVDTLVMLCLGSTLIGLLPSSLHLLLKPTVEHFKLALINSSLVFFLFSFQVHEKSILLAAIPVAAIAAEHPFCSFWFLHISTFSMLPLLIKDGLFVPYCGLTCLFCLLGILNMNSVNKNTAPTHTLIKCLFVVSFLGTVILSAALKWTKPPVRLPDLFPVLISIYSCGHFVLFLVYFHYHQLLHLWSRKSSKTVIAKKNK